MGLRLGGLWRRIGFSAAPAQFNAEMHEGLN